MSNMKIGTSLSFCIRDIILGNFDEDDVMFVVTATACKTEENWQELIQRYCDIYWVDNPKHAVEVLTRLREEKKIFQPRVVTNNCLSPAISKKWGSDVWWVDNMVDIKWHFNPVY